MMKKEYAISNMECNMCVLHLEGLQDELPGIHDIQANLRQQKLVINFDDQLIPEEHILKAIEKMGYHIRE